MPVAALVLAALVAALALAAVLPLAAEEPELDRTLAVEGDWQVVKRPAGAGCAVEAPLAGGSNLLRLIVVRDRLPVIRTPYVRGIQGYVIYAVDRSDPLYVSAAMVKDSTSIEIPKAMLREMMAGRMLTVQIDPAGGKNEAHQFSLAGLSAARAWLRKPVCQAETAPAESTESAARH
jgi:hypothetical protein